MNAGAMLDTQIKTILRPPLIVVKNATRDFKPFVKARQGFAQETRGARRSIISDKALGQVSAVATIGGGHLENPHYLAQDLGGKKIIAFDPVAKPARYIEKLINVDFYPEKFEEIGRKEIELLKRTNFIWEISNVFQTMFMPQKEKLLEKVWEVSKPGQFLVVVDEEISDSAQDKILNLLYNPEQIIFDRLTWEDYEALFRRKGFEIVKVKRHYKRDHFMAILKVVK